MLAPELQMKGLVRLVHNARTNTANKGPGFICTHCSHDHRAPEAAGAWATYCMLALDTLHISHSVRLGLRVLSWLTPGNRKSPQEDCGSLGLANADFCGGHCISLGMTVKGTMGLLASRVAAVKWQSLAAPDCPSDCSTVPRVYLQQWQTTVLHDAFSIPDISTNNYEA